MLSTQSFQGTRVISKKDVKFIILVSKEVPTFIVINAAIHQYSSQLISIINALMGQSVEII